MHLHQQQQELYEQDGYDAGGFNERDEEGLVLCKRYSFLVIVCGYIYLPPDRDNFSSLLIVVDEFNS